ncbi:unnamed protein product [Caenorhabditis auriculariae]|uniref:Uncharacterized protein n=1 Tax=Caenorhabditis auriculariae TaxID=2777116 RepID=A0A8S1GMA2_9PELO|nr:unnamed protein product [Caenorhabditis auriculariae]
MNSQTPSRSPKPRGRIDQISTDDDNSCSRVARRAASANLGYTSAKRERATRNELWMVNDGGRDPQALDGKLEISMPTAIHALTLEVDPPELSDRFKKKNLIEKMKENGLDVVLYVDTTLIIRKLYGWFFGCYYYDKATMFFVASGLWYPQQGSCGEKEQLSSGEREFATITASRDTDSVCLRSCGTTSRRIDTST